MAINDPLGDLLTRIRNAQMRRKDKVSTPKGVMADHAARENNVGGEVLCKVF